MKALSLFLRLTRPLAAVPFVFSFLMGAVAGGFMAPAPLAAYILSLTFTLGGAGHLINAYADRFIDRTSRIVKDIKMAEQPFAAGQISGRLGLSLGVLLYAAGLAILSTINPPALMAGSLLIIVGLIYSLPPRLKARPFWDILANIALAVLSLLLGFWLTQPAGPPPLLNMTWLASLVGATYLLTLLADYQEDRVQGVKTTAVALGIKKTVSLSAGLYAGSLVLFAWLTIKAPALYQVLLWPGLILGLKGYSRLLGRPSAAAAGRLMRRAARAAGAGVLIVFAVYSLVFLLLQL